MFSVPIEGGLQSTLFNFDASLKTDLIVTETNHRYTSLIIQDKHTQFYRIAIWEWDTLLSVCS